MRKKYVVFDLNQFLCNGTIPDSNKPGLREQIFVFTLKTVSIVIFYSIIIRMKSFDGRFLLIKHSNRGAFIFRRDTKHAESNIIYWKFNFASEIRCQKVFDA